MRQCGLGLQPDATAMLTGAGCAEGVAAGRAARHVVDLGLAARRSR